MTNIIRHPRTCPQCGKPLRRFVQDIKILRKRLFMADCQTLGCPQYAMTFTYQIVSGGNYDQPDIDDDAETLAVAV